jgi:hypothetical protein
MDSNSSNSNLKPGPLPTPPPSPADWKAAGGKGDPPLGYERVIRDAHNNALEYLIYHSFTTWPVSARDIERRISELERDRTAGRARYNKAAIYYLKKKLEELVLGEA